VAVTPRRARAGARCPRAAGIRSQEMSPGDAARALRLGRGRLVVTRDDADRIALPHDDSRPTDAALCCAFERLVQPRRRATRSRTHDDLRPRARLSAIIDFPIKQKKKRGQTKTKKKDKNKKKKSKKIKKNEEKK